MCLLQCHSTNFTVLMTTSFVDPLGFRRDSIVVEPWNTYRQWRSDDPNDEILMWLLLLIKAIALFQAHAGRPTKRALYQRNWVKRQVSEWQCSAGWRLDWLVFLWFCCNAIIGYFIKILLVFLLPCHCCFRSLFHRCGERRRLVFVTVKKARARVAYRP